MRVDQITLSDDGSVLVTFDTVAIEMPPGLDDLIRRHLDRPGSPSIASVDHGWLFPGRHPGRGVSEKMHQFAEVIPDQDAVVIADPA